MTYMQELFIGITHLNISMYNLKKKNTKHTQADGCLLFDLYFVQGYAVVREKSMFSKHLNTAFYAYYLLLFIITLQNTLHTQQV